MSKITKHLMFVDVDEQYKLNTRPSSQNINQLMYIQKAPDSKSDIIAKSFHKAHLDASINSNPITPTQQSAEETDILTTHAKNFKCTECKRYTANSEEKLIQHIRKVHQGEAPFQCCMCEYSTYKKSIFDDHIRMHLGSKPFKCSFCDHRTSSQNNIKKHEAIHRPDNPLKCPNCKFIAKHKSSLKNHVRYCKHGSVICKDVNNIICSKCNFVTKTRTEFQAHKKVCRVQLQQNMKRLFECSVCGWSSSSKHRVMLHLVHHPAQKHYPAIDLSILKKYNLLPQIPLLVDVEEDSV